MPFWLKLLQLTLLLYDDHDHDQEEGQRAQKRYNEGDDGDKKCESQENADQKEAGSRKTDHHQEDRREKDNCQEDHQEGLPKGRDEESVEEEEEDMSKPNFTIN